MMKRKTECVFMRFIGMATKLLYVAVFQKYLIAEHDTAVADRYRRRPGDDRFDRMAVRGAERTDSAIVAASEDKGKRTL
ncbi:hypothetical protein J2T09_001620 [Neorhizobium huautlense]|uniref:Secreted protein n=1 Tax=Neorhizobium huautlense TaxID=67774 RepID=A0ABT9PQZ0_9HYPH|nr:hypothetical protein [Neorhizobium huautlense]MDP9836875.1 hypothetical protein [Neorhizobium huautlense]